jgi:beta-galactosidase/beta-glucuronidase
MFDEYPRPQLERSDWLNLCGLWDYAITETAQAPSHWEGQILVPFSPEAPASQVSRLLKPGQYLWYHRLVDFPRYNDRVLLHFGAVDQKAVVWCNGQEVGAHLGGFTPFTLDITDALDENRHGELLVAVQDDTEKSSLARGKQRLNRGNIWYTSQSGIWQPVWAEAVPETYIESLRITPHFDESVIEIDAVPGGTVQFMGQEYPCPARIHLESFVPWTPEDPHLYGFTVQLGKDRVKSYFAMRKFSVENARLLLNNQVYFHNGVLDQGYNPEGLYTYPSDEAMIRDIQLAKDMGFNTLRKHMKVEPLRWYCHCDRLGMLVWQDMPCGGRGYNPAVVNLPLVSGRSMKDDKYKLFGRGDLAGRKQYYTELKEMVTTLYNCPSIAMWVAFNEGWGQFDAAKVLNFIRTLDDTRTIDHASGWHDQKVGQVRSYHVYFHKYRYLPDKLDRAVLLSEFGGYNLRTWGHTWNEKDFGYNSCVSPEDLEQKLRILYQREIALAKRAGLAAAIYTQLTDVEDELNGLITYDRQVVKIPTDRVKLITNI